VGGKGKPGGGVGKRGCISTAGKAM